MSNVLQCCPGPLTQAGGGVGGGQCIVSNSLEVWDCFETVLHLQETGNGTSGEYKDSTSHAHNGTGGGGNSVMTPIIDSGVFCLNSQQCLGKQYISVVEDAINPTVGMTVSLWGAITSWYTPRTFYSRGSFTLEYTYWNQVKATITTLPTLSTSATYSVTGATQLTQGKFYHLAAVWTPGVGLAVYVNGVQDGIKTVADTYSAPLTESLVASEDGGAFVVGNVQEVRLSGVARSAAWLLAEYNNVCATDFFSVA